MSGKRNADGIDEVDRPMEWRTTWKRKADGTDELVGNKKWCIEGSESLNVLLNLGT